MKSLREILIYLAVGLALYLVLMVTMQNYTVVFTSMMPSVQQGDWIRVSKVHYWVSAPARGDVIVFWPPSERDSSVPYIKRIIGVPGDVVEIRDGKVKVNGSLLFEPYISQPPNYTLAPTPVPAGQYFVLGDNRNNSIDSHGGWTVPRENIVGKAWFIYWPPGRWGMVPTAYLSADGAESPARG